MSLLLGPPGNEPPSYAYASHAATVEVLSHGSHDNLPVAPLRGSEDSDAILDDIVRREGLLGPGSDPARVDNALAYAARWGNVDVFTLLLARSTRRGREKALIAAASFGQMASVERLLAGGVNVHAETDKPLRFAARYGHEAVVAKLIAAGATINAADGYALHAAAFNGHAAVVRRRGATACACSLARLSMAWRGSRRLGAIVLSVWQAHIS